MLAMQAFAEDVEVFSRAPPAVPVLLWGGGQGETVDEDALGTELMSFFQQQAVGLLNLPVEDIASGENYFQPVRFFQLPQIPAQRRGISDRFRLPPPAGLCSLSEGRPRAARRSPRRPFLQNPV
jgi:hypothetical protein